MEGGGSSLFSFVPTRFHLPAQHQLFEDGDIHRHLYLQDLLTSITEEPERPSTCEFFCHVSGCCQDFDTLESYEHHYNMLHRNVCSSCKRTFPSAHLLDIHILEWHDSLFQIMAEKQNMFQCLIESCTEKFKSSKERKDHLIKAHRYPSDFRFDKPMKSKREIPKYCSRNQVRIPSRDNTIPMDVNAEDSEQLQGDAMEVGPSESMVQAALQPGMESTLVLPVCEKLLYRSRIPTTICFGHGATRGFKGRKKKA